MATACGGSSGATGTVNGKSVALPHAIVPYTQGKTSEVATVMLTDNSGACAIFQKGHVPKSTQVLQFAAEDVSTQTAPAGAYTVVDPNSNAASDPNAVAVGTLSTTTAAASNCLDTNTTVPIPALSGTFTLTTVGTTTSNTKGSFSVTLAGGDKLSGDFDAAPCVVTADAAASINGSTYTCD